MGADGHIIVVRRDDWDANCPDVKPEGIGLYEGTILGIEATWGYCGDNLWDGTNYGDEFNLTYDEAAADRKCSPEVTEKRKAALEWFNANAEWHEVWT